MSQCMQLYIDDLLEIEVAPSAASKALSNLLITYNSELRLVYDYAW